MNSSGRRTFLKQTATLAGAFSVNSLFQQAHGELWAEAAANVSGLNAERAAQNEDYWSVIQRAYSVNPDLINLNNGGVSPAPLVVQQAVERYNQLSNEGPSYYMWRILDQGREPLREKLAQLAGAQPGEIAIDRNSTEALNTIIYGLESEERRRGGRHETGLSQHDRGLSAEGHARGHRLQADQLRLSD